MLMRLAAMAIIALVATAPLRAGVALEVLKPTGENLLKADAWQPYGAGFAREGDVFVCDNGADEKVRRGACQTVVLNQTSPAPILATAWSKAEGVGGQANSDYSVYLDLVYQDGSPLYGQVGTFRTGTHDWQKAEVSVFPTRPVKQLTFNLLMRSHGGKACFKDPQLAAMKAPEGAAMFDGLAVRAIKRSRPPLGLMFRDVAAGSDFVDMGEADAMGLALRVDKLHPSRTVEDTPTSFSVTDKSGKDRALTLVYTVALPGKDWRWLAGPRLESVAETNMEHTWTLRAGNVGSNGRLSRYPFAAVGRGERGVAVATGLDRPAFFRAGYSSGLGMLYIAWDFALTREKPTMDVGGLAVLDFPGANGFRGAVDAYYRAFPDHFRCRTPEQGLWMPFYKISKVEGWEDFGFKFKEGNDETAWDDAHNILTFRYTEPMTWWMPLAKELPRNMATCLAEAERLAEKGDPNAKALQTSGFFDEAGRFPARIRNEPWCNGAVWSMNSSPGVPGEVTDFKNKWNTKIKEQLYGANRKGDLDGEYIDSTEGYATDLLDFRREHFAGARTPLVFASDTKAPALFRGLVAYEYSRAIADDVHAMGKLMMCNGVPNAYPWLAPIFDVLGTETDWNGGGRWQPMSDEELMYRRVLCGPKPYCFLMNTDFDKFSYERVEKYMKRCLAYGMFPGFFSADASTGHYFSRPDLYNRDRPLFKKYVPLVKRVAEAGWQPITRARSSDPKTYLERFGERYLTVFNDSAEAKTVTVSFEGAAQTPSSGPAGAGPQPRAAVPQRKCRELVAGADVSIKDGQATLTLGPEDVAVLDLQEAAPAEKR